jgi:transcriptional regulator with XRE-family HTH domain
MSNRSVKVDGWKVRSLRIKTGLNAQQFAEKAGVSPRSVLNAERGGAIYLSTLAAIAEGLGIKPEEILEGESNRPVSTQIVFNKSFSEMLKDPEVIGIIEDLFKALAKNGGISIRRVDHEALSVFMDLDAIVYTSLMVIAPNFREYVRDHFRQFLSCSDYYQGKPISLKGFREYLDISLAAAEAIKEIRIEPMPDAFEENDTIAPL